MESTFQIISADWFATYRQQLTIDVEKAMLEITQTELTSHSFTFYTSVAVISSSRIEGETMEVDSYVKHKMQDIEYLPELVQKPNDLYDAYLFAQNKELTETNFLEAHAILSTHLLPEKWRGKIRHGEMLVLGHNTGRIQYEASPASIVGKEFSKLWHDIKQLIYKKLTVEEVFYYASFIHVVFVNIHPFNDGNGRAARLLEKWFLAEKLGQNAWYIPSEKYYYANINNYYKNLARIGMFYEQVDYAKMDLFLQMLPQSLNANNL
jgi:Fic family protein